MTDFIFRQLASNHWTYIWIGCVCCLLVLGQRLVHRAIRLRHVLNSEAGAAYSLNLALVTPFYTLLVCFVIELTLMLNVQVGVDYAAFSTARSAAVWLTAETTPLSTADNLKAMVQRAAVQAMTPYAPSADQHVRANVVGTILPVNTSGSNDVQQYIRGYQQMAANTKQQTTEYVARKHNYAQVATRIHFEPSIEEILKRDPNADTTITATVHYEMPFNIPGVGVILGKRSTQGGYVRELTASVKLNLERPKTADGTLGFEYDSRPANGRPALLAPPTAHESEATNSTGEITIAASHEFEPVPDDIGSANPPKEESTTWNRFTGGLGCAIGTASIAITGAGTVTSCPLTGGLTCAAGVAVIVYEVDQTQASCRQLWTGKTTQTVGSTVLGGGWLGVAYDAAGLVKLLRNGGTKLPELIKKFKELDKFGELVRAARKVRELPNLLKELTKDTILKLLRKGIITAEEAQAAIRILKAKRAARLLAQLDDLNSPKARKLIETIARNSIHGPADAPLLLGKWYDTIEDGVGYVQLAKRDGMRYFETYTDFYRDIGSSAEKAWAVNKQILKNAIREGVPIRLVSQPSDHYRGWEFFKSVYAREIGWLNQHARELGYVYLGDLQWGLP